MKKEDVILMLAGLGGAVAIIALTIPLILTAMKPKPVKLTGKPVSFTYDYPYGDLAGERQWSQTADGMWREVYPDAKTIIYFKELRREKLEQCQGTVVERDDATNFKVLFADRDCQKQWLFYQVGDGEWQFAGTMKSVQ